MNVQFEGRLLATSSSYTDLKKRWTEYALFVTDEGGFIVVGIGRSIVPGETSRRWAKSCDLLGILPALSRGEKSLTSAGRELLRRAAVVDERIRSLIGA